MAPTEVPERRDTVCFSWDILRVIASPCACAKTQRRIVAGGTIKSWHQFGLKWTMHVNDITDVIDPLVGIVWETKELGPFFSSLGTSILTFLL